MKISITPEFRLDGSANITIANEAGVTLLITPERSYSAGSAKAEFDRESDAGIGENEMTGAAATWAKSAREAHRIYTKG
jgi:hypothetical protein